MQRRTALAATAAVLTLTVALSLIRAPQDAPSPTPGADIPMVAVIMPELQGDEVLGQRAFATGCAACHGIDASGLQGKGPPLVHKLYEPGHHSDAAIILAARNGVRAHHWRFGDMPAVKTLTVAELITIIAYLRALQRANGIL